MTTMPDPIHPSGDERAQFGPAPHDAAQAKVRPLTVTIEEAAALMGVSRALAYRLAVRGEIPARRLGGRWVVSRRRLEQFIDDDLPAAGAAPRAG